MSETQKHTKPNVPNLRFPGFEGEWEESTLGDCSTGFDYGMNAASKPFDGEHKYIRITDIDENTSEYKEDGVVSPDSEIDEHYRVNENDILFARTGASTGKTYLYSPKDGRLYFAGFLIRMNVSSLNNARFVFYLTQTSRYKKWVQIMSMRSGQPGINSQEYSSYRCFLPKLEEQQKIADLLTLVDRRISVQNKVIEDCTTLEKEIQNLVFSRINAPLVPLSSISERVAERNSALESDNVLTISAREGLISQLEFFNKTVASENLSNYYLLRKGDFAYNKSFSSDYPWGAIKHLERYDTGVLSPLYFCFRPNKEIVDTRYLQFFFDTKLWHKHIADIAVEGARNHGLLNMTVGDFYTMPILLPTMKEQKEIAEKLSAIREKRVVEESIYRLFLQQKRYLLEKLFI